MARRKFKLGDIVQLKSGGPKMTVTEEAEGDEDDAPLWCTWFAGAKKTVGEFPIGSLVSASEEAAKK